MKKNGQTHPAAPKDFKRKFLLKFSIFGLLTITILSLALNIIFAVKTVSASKKQALPAVTESLSKLNLIRENDGKQLIHPLLLAEMNSESARFSPLKWEITKTINEWVNLGKITMVSVYLKDLNTSDWMYLGADAGFLPGSLMKVPIMIYYLKAEQKHPGVLKTEYLYVKPKNGFPSQEFKGDSITPGKKYTVAELLRYMIDESDNNATYLLSIHIDQDRYRQLFLDLDIPPYEVQNNTYTITARQYSKFFRVLYNATYLNEQLSSYGLQLLSGCNFKEGMVKEIPKGITVAHKFGERGINYDMDFSESAIVYYNSQPYLLTIMTRGRDVKQQTGLVSEISRKIFLKYRDI